MALIDKLTAIGNAIREKTGKEELLTLDAMPEEIKGIETGGSAGDGFNDGNLRFTEYIVTIEEDNGVTNHENLLTYFNRKVGNKSVFGYSLIGYADTYNQPICGSGFVNPVCYRYRDGYISVPSAMGNTAYDAKLVAGTQYKVYCVERI